MTAPLISIWHLLWIVPVSALLGMWAAALFKANEQEEHHDD